MKALPNKQNKDVINFNSLIKIYNIKTKCQIYCTLLLEYLKEFFGSSVYRHNFPKTLLPNISMLRCLYGSWKR